MSKPFALVLAPGASGTPDDPSLVAIVHAVGAKHSLSVKFSTGKAERQIPAAQRFSADAVERAGVPAESVFLGGRSFGGRVFSLAVADGLAAAGLILISYPLHPPGRPDQLRTGHFPAITVPCLFVSGTRDAFGTPDELETAAAAIPGAVDHVWIEGGNHGLRAKDTEVAAAVKNWIDRAATP